MGSEGDILDLAIELQQKHVARHRAVSLLVATAQRSSSSLLAVLNRAVSLRQARPYDPGLRELCEMLAEAVRMSAEAELEEVPLDETGHGWRKEEQPAEGRTRDERVLDHIAEQIGDPVAEVIDIDHMTEVLEHLNKSETAGTGGRRRRRAWRR